MLDFDPNAQATTPRDAATVVVVRDARDGLEVFLVLRHVRSGFLGGAAVFPGGKLDASDADASWAGLASPLPARASHFAEEGGPTARAIAVAACRETFEEGAILPVDGALDDEGVRAMAAVVAAGSTLAGALRARGLRLALGSLVPWARWVTPVAEQRRFDARFFLLPLPAGQVGRHDDHETTSSFWARPLDVLGRAARGEVFLAPPTLHTLELLAAADGVAAAVALAERQSLAPICPLFVPAVGSEPPFLALPGDVAHPIAARRAAGPTRYRIEGAGFVGRVVEAPVALGAPEVSGKTPEE